MSIKISKDFQPPRGAALQEASRACVVRRGSDKFFTVAGLLCGLGFLLIFWPVGVLLIICAAIASGRFRCSSCMNRVDRHARMCPTCQSRFQ